MNVDEADLNFNVNLCLVMLKLYHVQPMLIHAIFALTKLDHFS